MNSFPKSVSIIEVGPRDGLQNEPGIIPLSYKLRLIESLADVGLKRIESGSFVSPKWVPQMADSADVFAQMKRSSEVIYSALTPNMQGFDAAMAAAVDEVAIFGAASESFSQKNINCSIDQSLQRFESIMQSAKAHNVRVRGYVSCVLGCPYEGTIDSQVTADVSQALFEMGCYEISLGDTIGVGTPTQTAEMLNAVLNKIPLSATAVHFHDTYGQALSNILVALQMGVTNIDAAVAGLGGCPYAKGASGNVATDDVVYMLNGMGIETGIDLNKLTAAGNNIVNVLSKTNQSKVAKAISSAA